MPTLADEARTRGFAEVELGYTVDQAVLEASRRQRCNQLGLAALKQKSL